MPGHFFESLGEAFARLPVSSRQFARTLAAYSAGWTLLAIAVACVLMTVGWLPSSGYGGRFALYWGLPGVPVLCAMAIVNEMGTVRECRNVNAALFLWLVAEIMLFALLGSPGSRLHPYVGFGLLLAATLTMSMGAASKYLRAPAA